MIVVADASAVGAFLLVDEAGSFADFARSVCRSAPLHVPAIWAAELANLLRTEHRHGRIDDLELEEAVSFAEALRLVVHVEPDPPIGSIVEHALRSGLSAYDTTYALLAARLNAPLLTIDGPLRRAAEAFGLEVLKP